MYHQEFGSPGELQDSIKCFWYTRIEEPGFEVVPDGYAEIIFHFGPHCSIMHNEHLQALPSPFMMGLLDRPLHFYAGERLEVIGIRCFPWTVFDLLGLPSEKKNVHIFEHPIARLQPSLADYMKSGNVDQAIALVRQYFMEAHALLPADSLLYKAGVAMRGAGGIIPVSDVAAAAHATVRTLERKFKQSSGHSVKDISGLMRFERARNQLWHHPDTNLAGLAVDLGYADQSHLTREFKKYAGTTPAAFARNAQKGKKILNGDFVAFVQS